MDINEIAVLLGRTKDEQFKNTLQTARALTRAINRLVPLTERMGQSEHPLMKLAESFNHTQIHS